MQFFVDSADLDAIKDLAATGMVDGVTTNPSLVAKAGRDFKELIAEICDLVAGPVSAEVTALEAEAMLAEADELLAIADNVCIKVPLTWDGLKATRALADRGKKVNVTLCFSANQALLAAKAGAAYISPFVGRLEDRGEDGIDLLRRIRVAFDIYGYTTQILAASIRSVDHVEAAACAGADIVTAPASVLTALLDHPLTSAGMQAFENDWRSSGQMI